MAKRLFFTVIFLFLSVFSISALAADNAPEKALWVEAKGEAYMGEIDTEKEIIDRAKKNAQSNALETGVGTFIRSHTLVSNSQIAEDLVYANVRGKVDKVEIIEEGWDKNDRHLYRVRLKALISPVYPEKTGGFVVNLALSKSDLKQGEDVRIFYRSNVDCYVYIFSIAADGSVTLLLPSSIQSDNAARAGKPYIFPPEGGKIKLSPMLLPGHSDDREKVKLIATRKKEDFVKLGFEEGVNKVYDAASTGLVSELIRRLNSLEPSDWTEAQTEYRIRK